MTMAAVLQANCLVVSDRQTAAQVVLHFRENKVGTANCKITAELSQDDRYTIPSAIFRLHGSRICIWNLASSMLDTCAGSHALLLTATASIKRKQLPQQYVFAGG